MPAGYPADYAATIEASKAEKGLVILSCGLYGNVIRFLVPLTASDAIVREGLGIVSDSLRELTGATAQAVVNAKPKDYAGLLAEPWFCGRRSRRARVPWSRASV